MHAMHARRASLESQSLLLHLEDACSFPNGVRQRNGQAAWVFYRFYPYLWVIVRMTARVITTIHACVGLRSRRIVVMTFAAIMGRRGARAILHGGFLQKSYAHPRP